MKSLCEAVIFAALAALVSAGSDHGISKSSNPLDQHDEVHPISKRSVGDMFSIFPWIRARMLPGSTTMLPVVEPTTLPPEIVTEIVELTNTPVIPMMDDHHIMKRSFPAMNAVGNLIHAPHGAINEMLRSIPGGSILTHQPPPPPPPPPKYARPLVAPAPIPSNVLGPIVQSLRPISVVYPKGKVPLAVPVVVKAVDPAATTLPPAVIPITTPAPPPPPATLTTAAPPPPPPAPVPVIPVPVGAVEPVVTLPPGLSERSPLVALGALPSLNPLPVPSLLPGVVQQILPAVVPVAVAPPTTTEIISARAEDDATTTQPPIVVVDPELTTLPPPELAPVIPVVPVVVPKPVHLELLHRNENEAAETPLVQRADTVGAPAENPLEDMIPTPPEDLGDLLGDLVS